MPDTPRGSGPSVTLDQLRQAHASLRDAELPEPPQAILRVTPQGLEDWFRRRLIEGMFARDDLVPDDPALVMSSYVVGILVRYGRCAYPLGRRLFEFLGRDHGASTPTELLFTAECAFVAYSFCPRGRRPADQLAFACSLGQALYLYHADCTGRPFGTTMSEQFERVGTVVREQFAVSA